MEIKPKTTASWVPGTLPRDLAPGGARAILFFGPDQGGIFEFARLAAGTGDRERMDAKSTDASEIISALGSASLFGGASTVVLDGAGDAQFKKIETILQAPFSDGARLIVLAGDLKASSKLRKMFQAGKDLLGVPLYAMRLNEIQAFATSHLKAQGLGLEADARHGLAERLSGDRALAARACEIVALHAIGKGRSKVALADVKAVLDTVDEDGLTAPFDHAIKGDAPAAARALHVRLASGENFIGMLRAFSNRAFRMRAMLASGLPASEAVEKARPPVFWAEKAAMKQMIGGLSLAKIDRILRMIDKAEYQIIEQGISPEATLGSMIVQISYHKGWKRVA
jgi:DNA polymerase-3 subunit delta